MLELPAGHVSGRIWCLRLRISQDGARGVQGDEASEPDDAQSTRVTANALPSVVHSRIRAIALALTYSAHNIVMAPLTTVAAPISAALLEATRALFSPAAVTSQY